ncbi:MAG: hypothetical protein ABI651_20460 [Verrucomicrobiota bacterium]
MREANYESKASRNTTGKGTSRRQLLITSAGVTAAATLAMPALAADSALPRRSPNNSNPKLKAKTI